MTAPGAQKATFSAMTGNATNQQLNRLVTHVAAHEDEVSWSEQEALGHLATLSIQTRRKAA
ncbi:hypothetical protein J7I98_30145 [Streptomyces sp. ISL-98]|uniref:TIGR02391 family protein n=1 Tax=Streptomyces sp. ISL-98 TaxID=2819192 RepID=UPI001C14DD12|nr:TIGR02391 family protein [Streptomyces sp. ISL-98]MBT2510043.1 hypothetical protein [Streptomyces sp. ISL-98]